MGSAQLEILSGWKEIANHLGKGVRTVQRYERELGLPIRRPAGKSNASVIATAGELDAWVTASPIRVQFKLTHPGLNVEMLEQLRRNLGETARLRRETEEVRRAVSESLALLRSNIHFALPETAAPGLRTDKRTDLRFQEEGSSIAGLARITNPPVDKGVRPLCDRAGRRLKLLQ